MDEKFSSILFEYKQATLLIQPYVKSYNFTCNLKANCIYMYLNIVNITSNSSFAMLSTIVFNDVFISEVKHNFI